MDQLKKIALGGGCHWCTEAVFQSLRGVELVEQGFVALKSDPLAFSEAVVVHYDPKSIGLNNLINIHLHTHQSTSAHSMRHKYRSAVYVFDHVDFQVSEHILCQLQLQFQAPLVTKVHYFEAFKPSKAQFQNYYKKNPQKPFCEKYILPKLEVLSQHFSEHLTKVKSQDQ